MPLERMKKKTREELLWPYILKILLEGPAYAYELRQEVEDRFGWEPPLTTTYTVLYRLERKDYIKGDWKKEGSRPKKYYNITGKGREILKEGKKYLKRLYSNLFREDITN
ncbi:MAG: PadR family transcriptional regulator [Candidatus Hadarchaeia archaeon]